MTSVHAAAWLLDALDRHLPAAAPLSWESCERTHQPWARSALAEIWSDDDFFWRAELGQGSVVKRTLPTQSHAVISLEMSSSPAALAGAAALLQGTAAPLRTAYGFVHELPGPTASRAGNAPAQDPVLYLTPRDLTKWLPDVWWGNVLGPSYAELIGESRILSAPAHQVQALGEHRYWIQMTEHPADVGAELRAQQVREHLGEAIFWRPGRTSFRTPRFLAPRERLDN